mgnify:CR=1 FL=1
MLNKLLLKQIGKFSVSPEKFLEENRELLNVISETYNHYDKDRKMLERSIELSSGEMIELNKKLRIEKKELEKRENTLKEAQRIAKLGSWEADLELEEIIWSDQIYEIFGYTPGEVVPSAELFLSFIHPEDMDQVRKNAEAGKKHYTWYSFTCRMHTKTGALKYIYTDCKFVLDNEGKPYKMYGIIQDITESHIAEMKIRHSESRLLQAQTIAHIGSWEVNLATNESVWSDEAYRIYGIEPGNHNLTFDAWLEFIHPMDLPGFIKEMERARKDFSDSTYYHRIIRPDGVERYVCSQSRYELNNSGIPVGIYGVVHDITEEKQSEIRMSNLLKVTREQNKRLRHFAYIVSHNIRSHSANIFALVDDLCDSLRIQGNETLDMLKISSEKLAETIEILNEIVSIQSERNKESEIINLNTCVGNLYEHLKTIYSKEDFEIMANIPEHLEIKVIPSYLNSILLNLVSNAIKFRSPYNKAIIKVDACINEDNVEISIKDNGVGIDMVKNGHKLFGLYKTFGNGNIGRGVGLFITKSQVEAMGGKIQVESVLGKGTMFKILLKMNALHPGFER